MDLRPARRIAFVLLACWIVTLLQFAGGVDAVTGNPQHGLGNITTVPLPQPFVGLSFAVGFVHSGTLGLVSTSSPDGSSSLVSFSMSTGQISDSADLTNDFGVFSKNSGAPTPQFEYVLAFDSSGLVAVYGEDGSGNEKIVMFECSQAGALSKLWVQSLPTLLTIPSTPSVQFNSDGSRLYAYYQLVTDASVAEGADALSLAGRANEGGRRSLPHLVSGSRIGVVQPSQVVRIGNTYAVLINTADGSIEDTFQVPTTGIDNGLVWGFIFDVQSDRLAASVGTSIYIFQDVPDHVSLTAKFSPPAISGTSASPIGVVGGRFLVSCGGGPEFFSTDLGTGATTTLLISGNISPYSNTMGVDQPGRSILVPYSFKQRIRGNDIQLNLSGTPVFDILSVADDGALTRSSRTVLPPSGASEPNVFRLADNAAPSVSGAMCFLPTISGNMFTVDVETGQIVNQVNLAPGALLFFLTLDAATDQIVFGAGYSLEIVDAPDHPVISGVDVKDAETIIKGASFLSGATVTINGESAPIVPGAASTPGQKITVGRGKADFGKGQQFTVVVTNRDGLSSNSFQFQR
jgi:hypothetical protein